MKSELKVFSGNGNPRLAKAICEYLRLPLGKLKLTRFSDGEVYCQVLENVRGTDVFVIQPTCPPVNENLMELLIAVDALKRSSAARITAVLPYYGYARQDRKDKARVPISSKLVADVLQAAGIDRILTLDLHAPAIQGFFDVPVDHLLAAPVLLDWIDHQESLPVGRHVVAPGGRGHFVGALEEQPWRPHGEQRLRRDVHRHQAV